MRNISVSQIFFGFAENFGELVRHASEDQFLSGRLA